jgi:hypothetical protein
MFRATMCPSSGENDCVIATSGICHLECVTVWYAGWNCAPNWFYLQDYTRMLHGQQNIKHRKLFTPVARRGFSLPVHNLPTSEQLQSTRLAVRSPFLGILFRSPGQSSYGAKEAQLSGHLTCESLTSFTIFLPHKTVVEKFLAFFGNRMFVTVVTD